MPVPLIKLTGEGHLPRPGVMGDKVDAGSVNHGRADHFGHLQELLDLLP